MLGVKDYVIHNFWQREARLNGLPLMNKSEVKQFADMKKNEEGAALQQPAFECFPVPEDPVVDHGYLLLDLPDDGCRWPIGVDTDGKFRFCGERKRAGSYCEEHHSIGLIPAGEPVKETSSGAKFSSNEMFPFLEDDVVEELDSRIDPDEESRRIGDEGF